VAAGAGAAGAVASQGRRCPPRIRLSRARSDLALVPSADESVRPGSITGPPPRRARPSPRAENLAGARVARNIGLLWPHCLKTDGIFYHPDPPISSAQQTRDRHEARPGRVSPRGHSCKSAVNPPSTRIVENAYQKKEQGQARGNTSAPRLAIKDVRTMLVADKPLRKISSAPTPTVPGTISTRPGSCYYITSKTRRITSPHHCRLLGPTRIAEQGIEGCRQSRGPTIRSISSSMTLSTPRMLRDGVPRRRRRAKTS